MAKILNKDPITYQRERDGFIRDLQHFHETRGTPFRKIPKINGHEIDLYLLYVLVTAHGGWVKVNTKNDWELLVEHFHLSKHCVNSGVALKQIYCRYLDRYEKVHFLGEDVERGSDDDEDSRHRRWSARALHSVPLTYNHHQHNIAENLRTYNGLSADLYKPSDYDRLLLSLMSPLPNEQDFAINVCTLLSNEGRHILRLDKCPRLIEVLLAHAGVFNHPSLRVYFDDVYGQVRRIPVHHFWYDILANVEFEDLVNETFYAEKKKQRGKCEIIVNDKDSNAVSNSACGSNVSARKNVAGKSSDNVQVFSEPTSDSRVENMEVDKEVTVKLEKEVKDERTSCEESAVNVSVEISDSSEVVEESRTCEMDTTVAVTEKNPHKLKLEPLDYELFCVGRSYGTQDLFGQRVLQIAIILRNLSFVEENAVVLSQNTTFMRFILLCAHSRWSSLHQIGMDMLTNIVGEFFLEDLSNNRISFCVFNTITNGLASQDRFMIVSCLEALNKLCQKDENEEIMMRCLDQMVYEQVCRFLTLHDIMLLIHTLECLYSLSSLGEKACNNIVRVHGAVDTLVSLITVEAQSYGPKACILMRVVETVTGTQASTSSTATTATATTSNTQTATMHTTTPVKQVVSSPAQKQITPHKTLIGVPQAAVATAVNISSQASHHQNQQQENENFATNWLKTTFELSAGSKIEQGEMYKQYLNACTRVGRRGVLTPHYFPRCVRSVFGNSVGPVQQRSCSVIAGSSPPPSTEIVQYVYDGIKVRASLFPVGFQGSTTQGMTHSQPTAMIRKNPHIVAKTVTPPPAAPPPKVATPPPISAATSPIPQPSSSVQQTPSSSHVTSPVTSSVPAEKSNLDTSLPVVPAPASPILKAQLSAPPKPRDTPKADVKSQVLAHPHLTQALLGASTTTGPVQTPKEVGGGCSTSLIKSLLATKVNHPGECMQPPTSMMPATTSVLCASGNNQPPAQVTQRQQQQRLLQQQLQSNPKDAVTSSQSVIIVSNSSSTTNQNSQTKPIIVSPGAIAKPKQVSTTVAIQIPSIVATQTSASQISKVIDQRKIARMNGARTVVPVSSQSESMKDSICTVSTTVTSNSMEVQTATLTTTATTSSIAENHLVGGVLRGRREPPQPPPPPLAPLSASVVQHTRLAQQSVECLPTVIASVSKECGDTNVVNISIPEDGDNSMSSFESLLLNGLPSSVDVDIPSPVNADSSDCNKSSSKPLTTKSLMLADLLEKKIEKKDPPILNGIIGKELRIGEKGLELVENHLERVLKDGAESARSTPTVVKEIPDDAANRVRGQVIKHNPPSVIVSNNSNAMFKTVATATDERVASGCEPVKIVSNETHTIVATKRTADVMKSEPDEDVPQAKRIHLSTNGIASPSIESSIKTENVPVEMVDADTINVACSSTEDFVKSETVSIKSEDANDNGEVVSASSSAANLYAALAASALEGEPDLELEPPPQQVIVKQEGGGIQIVQGPGGSMRQAVFLGGSMDASGQQLIVTSSPRQIIVSQGSLSQQNQQVIISPGGQLTLQQGKTAASHQSVPVLVQTGGGSTQRAQLATVAPQGAHLVQAGQVVLTQSSSGQYILSPAPPGQVQLVTGTGHAGQYIVSGGSAGASHYVVAQQQTALVQGQTQTVLVAQTPQQQGTASKTIIILQPQNSSTPTHHQKVVVTPQGQQVVVTQVPRPVLQSPAISNASSTKHVPTTVPASSATSQQKYHQLPHQQQPLSPPPPPSQAIPVKQLMSSSSNTPHASHIRTCPSPSVPSVQQQPIQRPTSQPQPISVVPSQSVITKTQTKPCLVTSTAHTSSSGLATTVNTVTKPVISSFQSRITKSYPGPRAQQQLIQPQSTGDVNERLGNQPITKVIKTTGNQMSSQVQQQKPCSNHPTPLDQTMFLCEWRGCMRNFKSANEVYLHACEAHCPIGTDEIQCLWERCDAMKRKRFSLMTHLYDRHCNADVLRMMAVRRKQLSQSGRSEIPPPQPPPPHPGYAPNAALHAIKRHALEFVNPKELMKTSKPGSASAGVQARTGGGPTEQDDNEGPVTKSIRLTSSLILRNLVIYSTNGRRFLRSYEPHLASVALSNVESSRTIAQVLYDMNQSTSRR